MAYKINAFIALLTLFLNECAEGSLFYGKLVLKTPSRARKHSLYAYTPTIFATRKSTYLKKEGDVFKIHIPGVFKNATKDTVSFESVRWPGYYLRPRVIGSDIKFRIAEPAKDEKDFEKEATFYIQRHSGIEGSGMLRLFNNPQYYLCVRKYYADSALKAMKNDHSHDFLERCSFYIQKLKPENVNEAVIKSTQNNNNKQSANAQQGGKKGEQKAALVKNNNAKQNPNNKPVDELPQSKKVAYKKAKNSPGKNKPTESAEQRVRHILEEYVKKFEKENLEPQNKPEVKNKSAPKKVAKEKVAAKKNVAKVQNAGQNTAAVFPTANFVNPYTQRQSWQSGYLQQPQASPFYNAYGNGYMNSQYTAQPMMENAAFQQQYPQQYGQQYYKSNPNMLSYFPVVARYDPTRTNIRAFFDNKQKEKLANQETTQGKHVGTQDGDWKQVKKPEDQTKVNNDVAKKQQKPTARIVKPKVKANKTAELKNAHAVKDKNDTVKITKAANNNLPNNNKSVKIIKEILKALPDVKIQTPESNKDGHHKSVKILKISNNNKEMGPKMPVNLHDFALKNHREPSLNLDGLISKIKVPETRSGMGNEGTKTTVNEKNLKESNKTSIGKEKDEAKKELFPEDSNNMQPNTAKKKRISKLDDEGLLSFPNYDQLEKNTDNDRERHLLGLADTLEASASLTADRLNKDSILKEVSALGFNGPGIRKALGNLTQDDSRKSKKLVEELSKDSDVLAVKSITESIFNRTEERIMGRNTTEEKPPPGVKVPSNPSPTPNHVFKPATTNAYNSSQDEKTKNGAKDGQTKTIIKEVATKALSNSIDELKKTTNDSSLIKELTDKDEALDKNIVKLREHLKQEVENIHIEDSSPEVKVGNNTVGSVENQTVVKEQPNTAAKETKSEAPLPGLKVVQDFYSGDSEGNSGEEPKVKPEHKKVEKENNFSHHKPITSSFANNKKKIKKNKSGKKTKEKQDLYSSGDSSEASGDTTENADWKTLDYDNNNNGEGGAFKEGGEQQFAGGESQAGEELKNESDDVSQQQTPSEGDQVTPGHTHPDGSDGITYNNVAKANDMKELGSTEMNGIAKAMAKLNTEDVKQLKTKMKTLEMIDAKSPHNKPPAEGTDYHEELKYISQDPSKVEAAPQVSPPLTGTAFADDTTQTAEGHLPAGPGVLPLTPGDTPGLPQEVLTGNMYNGPSQEAVRATHDAIDTLKDTDPELTAAATEVPVSEETPSTSPLQSSYMERAGDELADEVHETGDNYQTEDVQEDAMDLTKPYETKGVDVATSRSSLQHPRAVAPKTVRGIARNTVFKSPISNRKHQAVSENINKTSLHTKKLSYDLEAVGDEPLLTKVIKGAPQEIKLARGRNISNTIVESDTYPAKVVCGVTSPCEDDVTTTSHDVHVIRHTHHMLNAKDESEKEKMVNDLVDYKTDKCVSIKLDNRLGRRYRLVSSINNHGYLPKGRYFTLKTVFKDPSSHKTVSFHAVDDDRQQNILLDHLKDLELTPRNCHDQPRLIEVGDVITPISTVTGVGTGVVGVSKGVNNKQEKRKNYIYTPVKDDTDDDNDEEDDEVFRKRSEIWYPSEEDTVHVVKKNKHHLHRFSYSQSKKDDVLRIQQKH